MILSHQQEKEIVLKELLEEIYIKISPENKFLLNFLNFIDDLDKIKMISHEKIGHYNIKMIKSFLIITANCNINIK